MSLWLVCYTQWFHVYIYVFKKSYLPMKTEDTVIILAGLVLNCALIVYGDYSMPPGMHQGSGLFLAKIGVGSTSLSTSNSWVDSRIL